MMKRTGLHSKRPRSRRATSTDAEQWQAIAERDKWICQTCGESVRQPGCKPEVAHLIAETLSNIARYGYEVIDHPKNKRLVCGRSHAGRSCNDAQNIGFRTLEAETLAEEICEDIAKGESL